MTLSLFFSGSVDHSCACVYTWGLGTPKASQHNIFDSEKLTNFSSAPDEIRTFVL